MSNEELVAEIQAGAVERMGELWEQVKGLVAWKARHVMTGLENWGDPRGVELDDLVQTGYLALVKAVESYEQTGGAFSTWLLFYLKTAFAEVTGRRTEKSNMEPLNQALSLDKPLGDEADGATFGDLVPDHKAAATLTAVEEMVWLEQLREAMEGVLAELPEEQTGVLRQRYYGQQTLAATAQRMGTTAEEVRKLEGKGLKALRHYKLANRIRPFYDFDYYAGTGLSAFRNSGMSVQERYLIKQERSAAAKAE
jgi:RNA polymerase sigma factor (sigma-70 family)